MPVEVEDLIQQPVRHGPVLLAGWEPKKHRHKKTAAKAVLYILDEHRSPEAASGNAYKGMCIELLAAIDAAAGAGFVDADRAQFRQQWFQFIPDEFGQDFAGRVFQAGNVVQVVVIQALVERLENRFDLGEVADPACVRIEVAAQVNRHFERVAVKAPALVAVRYVRQAMGGFECKFLEDFHSSFGSVQMAFAAAIRAGGEFISLCLALLTKGSASARRGDHWQPVRGIRPPGAGSRPSPRASIFAGSAHRP